MGTLLQRVKTLNLPPDDYVVIGSGLLDALNLRESGDIDLVVGERLFIELQQSGKYRTEIRHEQPMLTNDDVEVWGDWKADAPFAVLRDSAVVIEGVAFANPEIIIKRKSERASLKDLRDIQLLEEYFHGK